MAVDIYHMHDGVACPNTAVANRLLNENRKMKAELEDDNAALRETVADYLTALDWSRQPYRQTARNAASAEQVRSRKRQALAQAETRLREAVADG